jgi:hypothetical protein
MNPVPKTPLEALEVFLSPDAEEWERDYAAIIVSRDDDVLAEALPYFEAIARDPNVDENLQQTVAGCLAVAWRNRGTLMTADVSGYAPAARREILFQRGEGPP